MKKLLLILIALPMIGFGQTTYVPDDNFEAYLEANGLGNGVFNDDYVTTASIDTVTYLNLQAQSISDLTGIEAFTALTWLNCENNMLTSLDVSQNTALTILSCQSNYNNNQQITSLNVSGCTALTELYCSYNNITSLDVSNNTALTRLWCDHNWLTSLDVSNNLALDWLGCDFNQISTLDVSNNLDLSSLTCMANNITNLDISSNTNINYFYCAYNQLISLDLRNGNNINMTNPFGSGSNGFSAVGNPNLTCINVDDSIYSTNNWVYGNLPNTVYSIDSTHYFSNHCPGTSPPQPQTYGCTDALACNYNLIATIDDSSCVYPYTTTDIITVCDNYTWDTITYTSSGLYTHLLSSQGGCDSIVILDLTIYNSTYSYDTLAVGASIVWNGMPLNVSGDYSVTLINSVGCDSIVNLNLTITIPSGILNITNTEKTLLKITDMLGQETPHRRNTPLFYIYDDGTVEKRIVLE